MIPAISVVMATYNGEEFIREAIDSILNQSFKDFEFIIVDDGSSDSTESIVASYTDPRIIFIKKEQNTGIADSLNLGIEKARGKYIARMDDDDISFPDRFQQQYDFLEGNLDHVLCCTNVDWSHQKNQTPQALEHTQLYLSLLFNNPIVHPTVLMRSSALKSLMYNPKMPPSEDYDLWTRMIVKGKFKKLKTPLLLYRFGQASQTTLRRYEQLKLNVKISKSMFENWNDNSLNNYKFEHAALISHNYSLKGAQLRRVKSWLESLKKINSNTLTFQEERFNKTIDQQWNIYLKKYFKNRTLLKKITPFIFLDLNSKLTIIKHYISNE